MEVVCIQILREVFQHLLQSFLIILPFTVNHILQTKDCCRNYCIPSRQRQQPLNATSFVTCASKFYTAFQPNLKKLRPAFQTLRMQRQLEMALDV